MGEQYTLFNEIGVTSRNEGIIKDYEDGIKVADICKKYDISVVTLYNVIKGCVQIKRFNKVSVDVKMEVVKDFYSNKYTVAQISKKYGITDGSVYKWVKEDKEGTLGVEKPIYERPASFDVNEAVKMYQNGMGIRRIGDYFDVTPATIKHHLIRLGVYLGQEVASSKQGKLTNEDRQSIIDKYVKEGISSIQLSEEFGVSASAILKMLKEHGIERRTDWTRKKKCTKSNSISEQVIRYYKSGLFTHENLAKKYDVSTRTISRILDKAGIEAIITAKYAPSSRIAEIMSDVKSDIEKGADEFEVAIKYNVTLDTITKIVNNDVKAVRKPKTDKEELKAQIIKAYEENKDIQSIAQQFDVKDSFVKNTLNNAGVDTHNTKLSRAKESVIESFKMGKEIELIAQEHELSKPSVVKILTEAGFETRTNKTIKAKDNIIQQFNLGVDIKQIAKDNDIGVASVIKVLKQEGLYQTSGNLNKEKAKQLYYQGLDIESIAGKLGLGVSYTKNILKDQGIDWTVKPEIKKTQVPEQITDLMIMKIKDAWNTYHDIDMVVKSQGFGEPFREVAIRELVKLGKIPSPDEREQP